MNNIISLCPAAFVLKNPAYPTMAQEGGENQKVSPVVCNTLFARGNEECRRCEERLK